MASLAFQETKLNSYNSQPDKKPSPPLNLKDVNAANSRL